MRRVAITGVTGFIGRHLARHALAEGRPVLGLARRSWAGPPHIPVRDRAFLELPARPAAGAFAGVGAVVHLAVAPQGCPEAVAWAVNVDGTRSLLDAAFGEGVERFVYVSSQSAHEEAVSLYGRTKRAAEERLAGDPRATIVRPGLVYGDGAEGLLGRAIELAARLRLAPVIGGEAARAQVIHVDDLCAALLRLADAGPQEGPVLLGDPEPRPLGRLIAVGARSRHGVDPLVVNVPIGAARGLVVSLKRVGLPVPFDAENIDGIRGFRPMDTTADMERLGVPARPFPASARPPPAAAGESPRRLVLVGAGRIGLVHALTSAHHHDLVLAGIVDRDRRAIARLGSVLGPGIPSATDLRAAIERVRPDAAIVATPPSSHAALARILLEAGVDVLVEKPLAASESERAAVLGLGTTHSDRCVSAGYFAALLPHVRAAADALAEGRYGTPARFEARSFVTRVEPGAAERQNLWELDPEVSGGGALINLSVHVVALLDRLLGRIALTEASLIVADGRRTEDAAWLRLTAGDVPGELATAWHLPGFSMPENIVRIETDRGLLAVTLACSAFLGNDGAAEVIHQLEHPSGFDLAPLDGGSGFWYEQALLARRENGRASLELAERVESLVAQAYRVADRRATRRRPLHDTEAVERTGPAGPVEGVGAGLARPGGTACLIDVRSGGEDVRRAALASGVSSLVLGSPRTETDRALAARPDSVISLPDVPGLFRIATNRGAAALARHLGVPSIAAAAARIRVTDALRPEARPWEILRTLLRAELARVASRFTGRLLVDAYLVDLATATGQAAQLARALDDLRRRCPRARIGLETNAAARLVPAWPYVADRCGVVLALSGPKAAGAEELIGSLPDEVEVVLKTGPLPAELLGRVWAEPGWWGAGRRVAVDWRGAPPLEPLARQAAAAAWAAAGNPG